MIDVGYWRSMTESGHSQRYSSSRLPTTFGRFPLKFGLTGFHKTRQSEQVPALRVFFDV